jgi:hypothetical protein
MAAKDLDRGGDPARKLVGEVADLWFHSMIALAHYGLKPADVIAELERREGTSGIEEKALRKGAARRGGRRIAIFIFDFTVRSCDGNRLRRIRGQDPATAR